MAHVPLAVWIGRGGPETQPDAIAPVYWTLYTRRDTAKHGSTAPGSTRPRGPPRSGQPPAAGNPAPPRTPPAELGPHTPGLAKRALTMAAKKPFELGFDTLGNTPITTIGGDDPTAQAIREALEAVRVTEAVGLAGYPTRGAGPAARGA